MSGGRARGTVRSITSTAVPTCGPGDTADEVIDALVGESWQSAATVYVVEDGALVGRVDVETLLESAGETSAAALMEPADARLHPGVDREGAIRLAIRTDRDELPVVDPDGRLVGAVTAGSIIDTMHREHVEDVLLGAGISGSGRRISELATSRVGAAVRGRAPWLLFGLVVGLFLSLVTSFFEAALRETVALAFFLPVVAYVADSVGTQSEAIAVRTFAIADVDYGAYLRREVAVGFVVGAMIGVLGAVGAVAIASSPRIGAVVGLSLFASSAVATVLATLVPIGFVALDLDPALGSGPLATALQDFVSVVVYFALAVSLL